MAGAHRKGLGWAVAAGLALGALGAFLFFDSQRRPYLDLIGYLFGVVGFVVLWIQIRNARTAAELGQRATQDAFDAMGERVTIADLSRFQSKFSHVQDALRSERFETALHHVQDLRAELIQLRSRGFGDENRKGEIQGIVTLLARFQSTLEKRLDDNTVEVPVPRMNGKLGEFIMSVAAWSEELQFTPEGHDGNT